MRGMEKVVELYRDLCKVPTVVRGRVLPYRIGTCGFQVESVWSQTDIARNDKVKYTRSHYVQLNPDGIPLESWPCGVATETNALITSTSPTGKLTAILRKVSPGKKCGDKSAPEAAEFLEVWKNKTESRVTSVNLKAADRHGTIHTDGVFGSLRWSYGEGHLLYVAEKKSKSMSFFDPKFDPNDPDLLEKEAVGDEFLLKESWGEQLGEVVHPHLCLFDVPSGNVTILDNCPKRINPAYAIWSPNDTGIVCVGYETHPRKLGITYCTTIKSSLLYYELSTGDWRELEMVDVPPEGNYYCNPTFSPDGSKLLFLQCPAFGTHKKALDLVMMNWNTKLIEKIIPVPSEVTKSSGFVGFYCDSFPRNCWAEDQNRLVLNTFEGSKSVIYVVNLETKSIAKISDNQKDSSWLVLDICKDLVLAQFSSPNDLPQLVVAKLPAAGQEATQVKWLILANQNSQLEGFSPKDYQVIHLKPSATNNKAELEYEAILVYPSDPVDKVPLIVKPHGGPHSIYLTDWSHMFTTSLWTTLGYAVLSVNYRGSIGFGAESIASLPGHVGTEDVRDVQNAVEKVLTDYTWLDRQNVFCLGGSHGGFLVTHLIGQFPNFYKACAALNPVIDIAAMHAYTDIPDWCVTNATGLNYDFNEPLKPEMFQKMWEKSPIRYAKQVKTPLLLVLGADDLRVPPKHSTEYRQILKANGTELKVLWYPENDHSLAKVGVEADLLLNIVKWFEAHMD